MAITFFTKRKELWLCAVVCARNCGYARMDDLGCAENHVLSCHFWWRKTEEDVYLGSHGKYSFMDSVYLSSHGEYSFRFCSQAAQALVVRNYYSFNLYANVP